jgi:hypothetical protein
MKVAADVQPTETVEAAIAAAKRVLAGPGRSLEPTVWLKAKESSDRLVRITKQRLEKTASMLTDQISKDRPDFTFSASSLPMVVSDDALGYEPNTRDYDRSSTLLINGGHNTFVQIEAHAVGSKFRGLIAFVAYFDTGRGTSQLASETPFQVNYAEPYESVERRFRVWLERSLARALTLWRQSL